MHCNKNCNAFFFALNSHFKSEINYNGLICQNHAQIDNKYSLCEWSIKLFFQRFFSEKILSFIEKLP